MSVLGNPILLLFGGSSQEPYFYDAGNEYTPVTGGWVRIGLNGSLSKGTSYMKLSGNPQTAQTKKGFDFTDYSTLYFDVSANETYEHSSVGLVDTSGSTTLSYFEKVSGKGRVTKVVDISNANGVFYPTVYTQTGTGGIYIYKVWAE